MQWFSYEKDYIKSQLPKYVELSSFQIVAQIAINWKIDFWSWNWNGNGKIETEFVTMTVTGNVCHEVCGNNGSGWNKLW